MAFIQLTPFVMVYIFVLQSPWLYALHVDDDNYMKGTVTDYKKDNVTCPPNKPLEWQNGTKTVCVASCGRNMVVEGSKCINVTECTKAVLSGGVCMDMCPEGYIYELFQYESSTCGDEYDPCRYTQTDIKNNPCVSRGYVIGRVVLLTFATLVYIVGVWFFFSTRRVCLCSKLVSFVCFYNQLIGFF